LAKFGRWELFLRHSVDSRKRGVASYYSCQFSADLRTSDWPSRCFRMTCKQADKSVLWNSDQTCLL